MQRQDIFERLEMNKFYWGDVFEIVPIDHDISVEESRLSLIDRICNNENLKTLGKGWTQLTFQQAEDLLTKALTFDLAYSSFVKAPTDKVDFFKSEILKDVNEEMIYCYTNWFGSPWDKEKGGSWNPLTKNTFDMGIVFLTKTKLTFAYFIGED